MSPILKKFSYMKLKNFDVIVIFNTLLFAFISAISIGFYLRYLSNYPIQKKQSINVAHIVNEKFKRDIYTPLSLDNSLNYEQKKFLYAKESNKKPILHQELKSPEIKKEIIEEKDKSTKIQAKTGNKIINQQVKKKSQVEKASNYPVETEAIIIAEKNQIKKLAVSR